MGIYLRGLTVAIQVWAMQDQAMQVVKHARPAEPIDRKDYPIALPAERVCIN